MIIDGKTVASLRVGGVDFRDYPDFCDAYFVEGLFENGEALTDQQLEQATELYGDVLHEMALDMVCE